MPVYELSEEQDKEILPEDAMYAAELVSVKEQEKTSRQNKPYKKLLWTFAIQEPNETFNGQYIFGDTFPDFSTRSDCELRAWAQEIMGLDEFPPGFNLDTDKLVGMQCRVVVGLREYEKDGKPRQTNFVKDVLRSRANVRFEEEPF
jgi:hypothetical protein